MKKKQDILHLLVLLAISFLSLSLIIKLRYSTWLQIKVVFILTLSYLIWSFVYHLHNKSLTKNIMIEYILTAALTLVIIMGLVI
ncbi:hypothetical protein HYW42_02610 [Candidatus Daviesbacteria bacterium]|nr:hypothetical protein [Candidatus Daviesbacteria bacterium]